MAAYTKDNPPSILNPGAIKHWLLYSGMNVLPCLVFTPGLSLTGLQILIEGATVCICNVNVTKNLQ